MPITTARSIRALPLVAVAVLAAYGLIAIEGWPGAALLVVTLLLAGALAARARRADPTARTLVASLATAFLLAAPALLVVFFSFSSGGFFPDSVALGALAVGLLLVVRLGVADRPLATLGPGALAPLVGLGGLAGWTLLSQLWSHAPGRAAVGFDRDLLYLLTFALFATVGRTRARLAWAVRAVALAMAGVAGLALLSRVTPDVLVVTQVAQSNGRLAYPLGYWNALGVFCAIAGVLCLHLAAADERWTIRVLSAGALPVVGTTLLLTYSRGGLGIAVIGVAVYAVLGRPRGLVPALIATAPAVTIAMKVAYGDTLLSSGGPLIPATVHQGHHLALVVLGCVALAIVLRALLLLADRALEAPDSPIDRHRRALRIAALGGAAIAIAAAIALGAPGAIANRWDQFVNQQTITTPGPTRTRLGSVSNQGRVELWTIAWNGFLAHPIDGTGAGTYDILWYEHRSHATPILNAHSLYIETLSDLGVVGAAFVLLFVLGTLAGLAPFRRGRDRALYAALFAAGIAWAVHAGVDWDWQMPAVSLWFAALGGLALGRPGWRRTAATTPACLRALAVGAVVVGACVLPALVLASQVRLKAATSAYAAGDCARADQLAGRAIDLLGTRAPPWQIEALCSIRARRFTQAQAQLRSGLAADPNDWELHAALAAALAAAGSDGRAQVAAAVRLNPLDLAVRALSQALAAGPSANARRAGVTFLSAQTLIGSG